MGTQFVENLDIMKFLVVVAASQAAPQLVYPYGLGYSHAITHAVPTTVKKTLTYKTAAFEPVDAATPADAQKIELKRPSTAWTTWSPDPSSTSPATWPLPPSPTPPTPASSPTPDSPLSLPPPPLRLRLSRRRE